MRPKSPASRRHASDEAGDGNAFRSFRRRGEIGATRKRRRAAWRRHAADASRAGETKVVGATMHTFSVFFFAAVSVGGFAWVFVYPILSGERHAERRMASVARAEPIAPRATRSGGKSRREQVETTLRELEERQKRSKRPPLSVRLSQAGLTWSKRRFIILAASLGVFAFLIAWLFGTGLLPALALGFAAGCGLPFWMLSFLKKRREARFLEGLPDAVDVIVRGIKAGLPVLDSMKVIAADGQEPMRTEFRNIVETQAIGIPLGDACLKLYERMPVPEANFFGIVISIQQRAGGNLSEALGNLSRVLRDRKRMKAKIQAMSMEAKASATIIGSLPIAVMILVYITSPNYIQLLWTEQLGRMMLAACAVWMTIGIFVMRRMINFDF
jgi:tight adherence protein B